MNKRNVVIIDYQLSNLFSVKHACDSIGVNSKISKEVDDLVHADAAILPGVGAFADAMDNLDKFGLTPVIMDFIAQGKPFIGICLGFQLLFSESEEFGTHKGLDVIKGKVVKFPSVNKDEKKMKVPHIGWNKIYQSKDGQNWKKSPLSTLKNNSFMYFVHSFYAIPDDKKVILTVTNYQDVEYCSSIFTKNIFATQFHPEKSGREGIGIYRNALVNIL